MLVYVNGEFVAAEDASISPYDRGFMIGDGVFDTWRTYGTRTVRAVLDKHLSRLRRSIRFLELDPGDLVAEIEAAGAELVKRNHDEIEAVGDVWVIPIVTRGQQDELGGDPLDVDRPSRVILIRPIFFAGKLYETGAHLITSTMARNPFGAVDPRVKATSRLGYVRGERKQKRAGPGNWVMFFDDHGFVTEASGANLLIVDGGTVVRPPSWSVLPGISLTIFCELAQELGIPVEERPLTMYDLLNADEVHLTSTSVAALPVADIDGIALERADDVGPRVLEAWKQLVDFDFVAQAAVGRPTAEIQGGLR